MMEWWGWLVDEKDEWFTGFMFMYLCVVEERRIISINMIWSSNGVEPTGRFFCRYPWEAGGYQPQQHRSSYSLPKEFGREKKPLRRGQLSVRPTWNIGLFFFPPDTANFHVGATDAWGRCVRGGGSGGCLSRLSEPRFCESDAVFMTRG